MRVGLMVTGIGVPPGREKNVSGHVQLPMRTAALLREAGAEVHLIATRFRDGYVLPAVVPDPAIVPLHFVEDGRRRGEIGKQNTKVGYHPLTMVRQLRQILRLSRDLKLDVLHLFGMDRMTRLAGVLKALGNDCPVVSTAYMPLQPSLWSPIYRKVNAIVCSAQYVTDMCTNIGDNTRLIRPGIDRDFRVELNGLKPGERRRVLFWRAATYDQGCDLVVDMFDALAPKYPDFTFDLAVRDHRDEIPDVEALRDKHSNVNLFRFPYSGDISLARLIAEALFVVLPFRKLSIHPQLAIAESLKAGAATVCTDIGSCSELVVHGRTGLVVPPGDGHALTSAVEQLLNDVNGTLRMGQEAERDIETRWNWRNYTEQIMRLYSQLQPSSS